MPVSERRLRLSALNGKSREGSVKLTNSPGSSNTGRTNVRTAKLLLLTLLTGYNTLCSCSCIILVFLILLSTFFINQLAASIQIEGPQSGSGFILLDRPTAIIGSRYRSFLALNIRIYLLLFILWSNNAVLYSNICNSQFFFLTHFM